MDVVDINRLKMQLRNGRSQARTSRELTKVCQVTDRELRLVIRDFIAGGLPVASSTSGTKGYFIAQTDEEVKGYILELRSRIIETCKRLRDFKRAARTLLSPGQLPLL